MGILRSKVTPVYMKQMSSAGCLTYIPYDPTPGAITVGDGKDHATFDLAYAAAAPGDYIDLYSSAGNAAYNSQKYGGLAMNTNVTITQIDRDVRFTGQCEFDIRFAGAWRGVVFDLEYTSYGILFEMNLSSDVCNLERCWIEATYSAGGGASVLFYNKSTSSTFYVDSCVFIWDGNSPILQQQDDNSIFRNCILDGSAIPAANVINHALGCFNDYFNCAVYGGGGACFAGPVGTVRGDYCASTDATAPNDGGNSHFNINWGNEFNANYEPILATSTLYTAGAFAQVPAADYYGNTFPNPPCIGAINCPV